MIKYIVKEKEKVVVAIIDNCSLDAVQKIFKRVPSIGDLSTNSTDSVEALDLDIAIMPSKFVGVAKCDNEDNFDEAKGKELAASRAKEKYHRCLKRTVNNWVNKQRKKLNNVEMK